MNLSAATAQATQSQQNQQNANTRLSGGWLILARVVWIVLVVGILGYFIASLPQTFVTLHQPCVGVWCTNAIGRSTLVSLSV